MSDPKKIGQEIADDRVEHVSWETRELGVTIGMHPATWNGSSFGTLADRAWLASRSTPLPSQSKGHALRYDSLQNCAVGEYYNADPGKEEGHRSRFAEGLCPGQGSCRSETAQAASGM
jgi:hypothetical protein